MGENAESRAGRKRLAVSIVAYRIDLDEMRRAVSCLNSDVVSRIFVIDNASEQRVADAARELGVDYTASPNNGYGAGHNIAINRTLAGGEDYHLVMNSDVIFDPADLGRMIEYMDANPDVGALHPRVVGADGSEQYTARLLPTPFDLILRRFVPSFMFRQSRDRYLLKHLDHDMAHDVPYMQGSFMLLRTDTLRKVGGFDERYFMYSEDIDLSRRLARVSRVVYWPGAVVKHFFRRASYKSVRMLWVHVVNTVRYFNKWGWWSDSERQRINRSMVED